MVITWLFSGALVATVEESTAADKGLGETTSVVIGGSVYSMGVLVSFE